MLGISEDMDYGADQAVVFRSAHDSSNSMREWMGEAKKKR